MNTNTKELLNAEQHARTADDVDEDTKTPGQCWRYQRLIIEEMGLPSPGPGLDAKAAAAWYRKRGFAIDAKHSTQPGDLYFWLDGKHGHVAMRIRGNLLGENSSVHSTAGSDARGTRKLSELRPVDIVIRLIGAK
jgi:hypothetical protein